MFTHGETEQLKFVVTMFTAAETLKFPPAAELVPPPTNVAVVAAFVMSATSTFWSIVTVNPLL
jgi:hypothetical protein